MIGSIAQAVAQFFRFLSGRQEAKNTAEVRAGARAQNAVEEKSRIEKSVAEGKDDEYRKQISE